MTHITTSADDSPKWRPPRRAKAHECGQEVQHYGHDGIDLVFGCTLPPHDERIPHLAGIGDDKYVRLWHGSTRPDRLVTVQYIGEDKRVEGREF